MSCRWDAVGMWNVVMLPISQRSKITRLLLVNNDAETRFAYVRPHMRVDLPAKNGRRW